MLADLTQPTHLSILPIIFFLLFGGYVLPIVAYWKIFSKAGFSGPLALPTFVPIVSLCVLFYVAFAPWKARPSMSV